MKTKVLILFILFSGLVPIACRPDCRLLFPYQLMMNSLTMDVYGADTASISFHLLCTAEPVRPQHGNRCFATVPNVEYTLGNKITAIAVSSDSVFNQQAPGTDLINYFTAYGYIGDHPVSIDEYIAQINNYVDRMGSFSGELITGRPASGALHHNFTISVTLQDSVVLSDTIAVVWQ